MKNRNSLLLITIVALTTASIAQTKPGDFGFIQKYVILNKDTINYYIFDNDSTLKIKKPLLLYLQGSGAEPILTVYKDGRKSSVLILGPSLLKGAYHYVVIGKPGVKFADNESPTVTSDYDKKMSIDYRVNAADAVINELIKSNSIDKSKIILVGHSEGGQIAPKIASINKNVTQIACLSGTGINQMYDFLIQFRKKVEANQLATEEANKQIDSLFWYYKDIMKNPLSTEKKWAGHTYLRWSSAINNPPLNYLLKLNIPIYIAIGTADKATSIENMDNIPIEFIKAGKNNLTYKCYWNYDHTYNEIIIKEDGKYDVRNHIPEVTTDLLKWLSEN